MTGHSRWLKRVFVLAAQWLPSIVMLIAIGASSYLVAVHGQSIVPLIWFEVSEPRVDEIDVRQDRELTLVYIGSSTCGPSNSPALRKQLADARESLVKQARTQKLRFRTVGISRDSTVQAGLRHLYRMGPFDEVLTGRNWLNLGIERYVRSQMPGVAATPQLVVTLRRLSTVEGRSSSILDEVVVVRKVGLDEIQAWLDVGAHFVISADQETWRDE